jgi:hypothetical protein
MDLLLGLSWSGEASRSACDALFAIMMKLFSIDSRNVHMRQEFGRCFGNTLGSV